MRVPAHPVDRRSGLQPALLAMLLLCVGPLLSQWLNSSDDRPLAQTPPLEARFGLGYERSDWSAGALWRVVAAQNRVDEGKGNVVGKDFGKSGGFALFSLNGAYRIGASVKLSAGVDNLFDRHYSEHLNLAGNAGFGFSMDGPQALSEPGRILWSKVDFSF